MTMACAKCGSDKTEVVDSRANVKGDAVRRRRRCISCHHRFSTYEIDSEVFADAIERCAKVATARSDAIERFAATLPETPETNPMRLRPHRRSA